MALGLTPKKNQTQKDEKRKIFLSFSENLSKKDKKAFYYLAYFRFQFLFEFFSLFFAFSFEDELLSFPNFIQVKEGIQFLFIISSLIFEKEEIGSN